MKWVTRSHVHVDRVGSAWLALCLVSFAGGERLRLVARSDFTQALRPGEDSAAYTLIRNQRWFFVALIQIVRT